MNELEIFKNENYGEIRTLNIDGEPWFVAAYDTFVSPEDCTNIRATAKELQVPERKFCDFLVEQKYLYRSPAGKLMPYAKAQNEGLFRVKDFCVRGHKGEYTLTTPIGKDLFRKLTENLRNHT